MSVTVLPLTDVHALEIYVRRMAPNEVYPHIYEPKKVQPGEETYNEEGAKLYKLQTDPNYKHKYISVAVVIFTLLHAGALYGLYVMLTFKLKLLTYIWGFIVGIGALLGGVLGSHRGFCHRAFKVNTFGKVLLILLQTVSGQNDIYWWSRDHRLHHKFVDTDADPYNAKRGFFFSHIGWLMTYKHPLVKEKGKIIDMSDMESDKLIMFQKKYYIPLFLLFNIAIPMAVPVYLWNEDFWLCFFTVFLYRYVHVLNATWSINSVAHYFGDRAFDARITARMSKACHVITLGDGWHNYHHAFPLHHGISEFGYGGGVGTRVLHLMARLGIAYDLKTESPTVVYHHSKRYGDGSIALDEMILKSD